jgi:hypothetical protein
MSAARSTSVALSMIVLMALAPVSCRREPERCAICRMAIPADTRAVVEIDGRRRTVCDPRCALTFHDQTHKPVRLDLVTEFRTGARIDPRDAVFVTGSDVAPDGHTSALRDTPATTVPLHWHRCLPSVLAFGTLAEATAFQRQHGGRIMAVGDLGFVDASASR